MNLVLFIVTVSISFTVVRLGAVAFHLTGIEWSQSKFQALSCFSGTGFTTRISEMIVAHPQRRRIATTLMVLGNAGIVTLIATFANSIRADNLFENIELPFLDLIFPAFVLPIANLIVIIFAVFILFRFFSSTRISRRITGVLKQYIIKKQLVRIATFEELLVTGGDYGIIRLEIDKTNPLQGTTLMTSGLRDRDITVLAIERGHVTTSNPKADQQIKVGDHLICYGNLSNIRKLASDSPDLLNDEPSEP